MSGLLVGGNQVPHPLDGRHFGTWIAVAAAVATAAAAAFVVAGCSLHACRHMYICRQMNDDDDDGHDGDDEVPARLSIDQEAFRGSFEVIYYEHPRWTGKSLHVNVNAGPAVYRTPDQHREAWAVGSATVVAESETPAAHIHRFLA